MPLISSISKKFLISLFLLSSFSAYAADSVSSPELINPEKGWFWFDDPKEATPDEEVSEPKLSLPTTPPPPPKEEKCTKKDTWSPDCGFVNPGKDFEFQAKQRDALFEQMSVSNNDPKAVEAVQYYMRWVLERTSEVTNLWWYNMTQNPDLDPTVSQPVSAFGLRLMSDVKKGADKEIFSLLKEEGAFYVYFTKSDCEFCHQMAPNVIDMAKRVGIPVYNSALDSTCLPGFSKEFCRVNAVEPATRLQVSTVPTVFLFIPKNTWIRIGTGVTDLDSMLNRTTQFFTAYRSALLKGVENGEKGRASVDFSGNQPSGNAIGIDSSRLKLPTEKDIQEFVGKDK